MLNLDTLRSFAEVAKSGSFSRAAQVLGLSQPTVSEHIRSLEDRLGLALIVRGRRQSALTPDGERVLVTAERIIELSTALFLTKNPSSLRLGVSSNILVYYLATQVAWLKQAGVLIETKTNPDLAQGLRNGAIDLAVMEWPVEDTGIGVRPLFEDPLLVIVNPSHPLANLQHITLKQLKTLSLWGGESGTGTYSLLKTALGRDADALKMDGNLGSTEAVKQAVIAGAGASIVLAGAVEREISDGRLIGLKVKGHRLTKKFYLCAREAVLESSETAALVKQLADSFVQ